MLVSDDDRPVLSKDQVLVRREEAQFPGDTEGDEHQHHRGEECAIGDHLKAWSMRTYVMVRPSGLTGMTTAGT